MSFCISLKDISVIFNNKKILSKISLNLISNRILTLIGPNGAGKSTLVKIILKLLKPSKGTITYNQNLRIGYVPQKLNFNFTLPITVQRFMKLSKNQQSVKNVLFRVSANHLKYTLLSRLSSGEMQKILLARALLNDPQLLVLDEPTQGMDILSQTTFYKLVTEIRNELKCSIVIVSHDLSLVMSNTDEVVCLNKHICCSGSPKIISKDSRFIAIFGHLKKNHLALYHHKHNHYHDF
ncbi:zinc ABC transporter ATPase [Buchnera aphidicola (Schlechtendalia chinensis)]|uniref:Zinc ABC transporter ATPase n=1 Tax=Buchnera aphidicola subsp. Schlechtendalia chinensis TaxID=118110 RepID=A0A172WDM5_BUCSC|nr:zinc ABC transporter ATP-binding protein ZnuC [Buchnera aphidicola]ANF17074.1 zinc ABC transporter ATPase [Buchnera aphidicola (Schlechtendalia chinensis)]